MTADGTPRTPKMPGTATPQPTSNGGVEVQRDPGDSGSAADGKTLRAGVSPSLERRSAEARTPLTYHRRPGAGLAIINPLSYGVTIDGVAAASGQDAFLDALGAGFDLVTYDQRGHGGSAHAGAADGWDELGADLWRVADAAGVERAVLYGVADAGHTIVHAARQQPDRVLGLIFNFVPPTIGLAADDAPGLSLRDLDRWFSQSRANPLGDALNMMESLGINTTDATALISVWEHSVTPETVAQTREILAGSDLRPALAGLSKPALVLEPKRRELFRGWGNALAASLPDARVVSPTRGIESVGAMHGFLAVLTSDLGRRASRLSPQLSATVASSEQAVGALRCIAVAVDDDASSGPAVELACRLGEAQRARIVLVHIVPVPYTMPLDAPPEDAIERGERALELGGAIVARHKFAACAPRLVPGRSIPGAIVRIAQEEGADLIVVSDSPRRDERSAIVADVLHRAPGKVLVNSGRAV